MRSTRKMTNIILAVLIGLGAIIADNQAYAQFGSWETKSPMPTPRWGAGAGVIDGKLYVVGGNGPSELTTLEVYDPATDTWATKAPMPTARSGIGVGVIDGKLYVVGGDSSSKLTTLEVYDPATDTWATKASMSTPRSTPGTAAIGGKLYVTGGCQGYCSPVTNILEVYDSAADTWATKAAMPTGRGNADVAVVNDLFYVMGGCCGATGPESDAMAQAIEEYDPTADTWATKTPHLVGSNGTAGSINGKIYVEEENPEGFEIYDPAADSWDPHSLSPMPTSRSSSAGGVINGKLYVAGGYDGTQGLATLEVYTPDSDFDGVIDSLDAFPNDPAASKDTDGDGHPDEWNANATPEMIAASTLTLDAFPNDPNRWLPSEHSSGCFIKTLESALTREF
jgi:N-acetylneuraminic acid mutarotase